MSSGKEDILSRRRAITRLGALALGAYTIPAFTTLSLAEAKSSGSSGGGSGRSGGSGSSGRSGSSDSSGSSGSTGPSNSEDGSSGTTGPSVCSGPGDDDAGCGG